MNRRIFLMDWSKNLARLHGGTYTIRVIGQHLSGKHAADWNTHVDGEETVLTETAASTGFLPPWMRQDMSLNRRIKLQLTADVFLRLLGENGLILRAFVGEVRKKPAVAVELSLQHAV